MNRIAPALAGLSLFLFVPAATRAADDQATVDASLRSARQLYEAAQYADALAAIDAVDSTRASTSEAAQRAIYRALCFIALNRTVDAETAVRELIEAQPLFRAEDDVPPRLQALVSTVADRLRPALVRQHYKIGKQQFDAKDYAAARAEFTLVVQLAARAGEDGAQFEDVKVVAEGFKDLADQALRSAAASSPESTPMLPPVAQAAAPSEATATVVIPPTTVRQDVPPWPASIHSAPPMGALTGLAEVVIGPTGEVESVRLVKRIHPMYDGLLLAAAKKWRYEPATRDGQPIPYTKQLEIKVAPK